MIRLFLTTALGAALLSTPSLAEQHEDGATSGDGGGVTTAATAAVTDAEGAEIGTVTINETASGTPLVVVALTDLPEGAHGIHLHETGDCSAGDYTSAGGHIAGDAAHGVYDSDGPHPGDLPNGLVGSDGDLTVEFFAPDLDIGGMILDEDGSAFIVHAGPDDYVSQPSGNSGDRIACGVFEET